MGTTLIILHHFHTTSSKKIKSPKILEVHKKSHDKLTSHHCDQCDQDFTQIGELNRHVNSVHTKLNFSYAVACGRLWNGIPQKGCDEKTF